MHQGIIFQTDNTVTVIQCVRARACVRVFTHMHVSVVMCN